MKNILAFLLFVSLFAYSATAQDSQKSNGPAVEFSDNIIDYGTIKQDDNGIRYVEFTNTGTAPLLISNAKGSCGCTVPTYPKEPVMPGESAKIQVKYDTHRIGAFSKTVTITSNATNEPTKVITIKGTVQPKE